MKIVVSCLLLLAGLAVSSADDTTIEETHVPANVSLKLGHTLNPDDIKEGYDVYFECTVKDNQPWKQLIWLHDGAVLNHNLSVGVLINNHIVVLFKVTRKSAGDYMCLVENTAGVTASDAFNLRIKYPPSCRRDSIMVVSASRGESLDIPCQVDSNPPAKTFKWKFNNYDVTLKVEKERFADTSNGTTSILRYTPVSELDYGTLSCWAQNDIGIQTKPCIFQVVAAENTTSLN